MSAYGNWNRTAVKRRIGELAAFAMQDFDFGDGRPTADVRVEYSWDNAQSFPSTVWLGFLQGAAEPSAVSSGTTTTDEFTVHIGIVLTDFKTGEMAEQAAENALRAVDGVLRACGQFLVNDAVPATEPDELSGLSKAVIGDVNGPYHAVDQAGSGQVSGHVEFLVRCRTDIRP